MEMNDAHVRRLEREYGYCEPDMLGLDMAGVDGIIERHDADPDNLVQILLDIQEANAWLQEEILELVAERLEIPLIQVMSTASFYKTFSLVPKGRHQIHICTGTTCHLQGAERVLETVEDIIGLKPGENDLDRKFSLKTVNCLGSCALAPAIEMDGNIHGKMTPGETVRILKSYQ